MYVGVDFIDLFRRNVDQWTPLDFSSAGGHKVVVKYLLSEDVPVNPMDKERVSPASALYFIYVVHLFVDWVSFNDLIVADAIASRL